MTRRSIVKLLWHISNTHQVVSRSSATIEGAEAYGFEANHQNMQRFESPKDPDYMKIKYYIQKFVNNLEKSSAYIHQGKY